MPRTKPQQPDMTYRLLCEAEDHFGCIVFEGASPEEVQAKFQEANRVREAAGKSPLVVLPYTVIAL